MDIQRAAELLAAHSAKEFGNALKDRDDPFKDFYKSLPICILDAVISSRTSRSMIRLRTFQRMCSTICSGLPAATGF